MSGAGRRREAGESGPGREPEEERNSTEETRAAGGRRREESERCCNREDSACLGSAGIVRSRSRTRESPWTRRRAGFAVPRGCAKERRREGRPACWLADAFSAGGGGPGPAKEKE